jgi:hypothetical protein
MKWLLFLGMGFLPMSGVVTTNVSQDWTQLCAYHLDGQMKIYAEIKNTGNATFTACQLQEWSGSAWENSAVTIPGCASLPPNETLQWGMTTANNNRVRILAKSAGTTASCQLFRKGR